MILPLNKLRSDYSASVCRWFYERGHASCLHFTVQCYCIWHMYVYTLMHSVSTVAHPNLSAINCGVSRLKIRTRAIIIGSWILTMNKGKIFWKNPLEKVKIQQTFENKKFVDQQCIAFLHQVNFPTNNSNFH